MEKYAEILKDLIDEKGVSLRSVEQNTGVASSQLSRYLKSTIPSIPVAIKLANYFECSLDYLFGVSENKNFKNYKSFDLTNFVPRYEAILRQNNTTHWKFAKEHNISEACLRHWRYGEQPRLDTLAVIAKHLGTSIDYLIGRV